VLSNPFLGVLLHGLGGVAAGSFYLPYKKVRVWAWESYWLVGGFFSWIIAPVTVAWLINPRVFEILRSAPPESILWTYFFGVLWGFGGLTFGLSMRYLGLSLGYALALGLCAAFGTLIPPLFLGQFPELMEKVSGRIILAGVGVCLAGIALCGQAGRLKERELPEEEKAKTIREFNFIKGVWVAFFAGVMSACMAFAFQAGKPIAEAAAAMGTPVFWKNTPLLVVVLLGGFTTNFLWCLFLNLKNGTFGDYTGAQKSPLLSNYFFSALAGVTWYFQFFFYGMGTTYMGKYDFSSWTLHMAFIIIISNVWGLLLHEWRGASPAAHKLIRFGIVVLILSTIVVGYGNYLGVLSTPK
jgi:L-rhamnose-H+ transport protein